ncbi:MAG: TolC family protein, partial [Thermoanaerobaculia bacterium]
MNSRTVSGVVVVLVLSSGAALAQTAGPEALTLRKAAELALARAPELAAARAARDVGQASADLARDAFRPSAWLTTAPGYTHGLPGVVAGRVPAVAGVEIRQAIYDPARRSDALQAQASASSLDSELEQACRSTLERLVAAYART